MTLGIRNGRVGVGLANSDAEVDVLRDAAKKLVDVLGEITPYLYVMWCTVPDISCQ